MIEKTFYNDKGDEEVIKFPTKWEICDDCQGNGTTYLGWASRDQPAFTREDFDREGPDFFEDYMSGAYDKECPACKGSGKVKVIDEAQCKLEDLKRLHDAEREEAEYQAICEMERRMGC